MRCWNETQVAAAQVRNLQSRLMVGTMQCRARGIDITHAYNRFVTANRSTIRSANRVLLVQFQDGFGNDGDYQYDRFATSLANRYGGGETDPWICADMEDLAFEAANARGDVQRLLALADRISGPPRLPGGRCEINFDMAEAHTVGAPDFEQVVREPVRAPVFDQVEVVPAPEEPSATVEAAPIARDRLDEVEEIPAPSDAVEDFQVYRGPVVRERGKPAQKLWVRGHI